MLKFYTISILSITCIETSVTIFIHKNHSVSNSSRTPAFQSYLIAVIYTAFLKQFAFMAVVWFACYNGKDYIGPHSAQHNQIYKQHFAFDEGILASCVVLIRASHQPQDKNIQRRKQDEVAYALADHTFFTLPHSATMLGCLHRSSNISRDLL